MFGAGSGLDPGGVNIFVVSFLALREVGECLPPPVPEEIECVGPVPAWTRGGFQYICNFVLSLKRSGFWAGSCLDPGGGSIYL